MNEPALAESGDAALISRIRAGDVSAYGILYERHRAAARGLARHLAGRDAAEDAVQDAFAKVLTVLKRGGGPDAGFRPYLLTVVRRTVYDRQRADGRVHHTGTIEDFDPGAPFEDPAVAELERSMIARAFRSLPGRWRAVLWHTEVEGAKPAEVAPLLGLTANGAAALAYRAREGLRQAYLQMHLDGLPADDACRPALDKLGSYVRGALAKRDARTVKRHLDGCTRCEGIHTELVDVNSALRDVLGPLVLGTATTGYLASKGGAFLWFRQLPKRQQQALGGGVVAVAGALALGLMLVSGEESIRPEPTPPVAAEPATPPAAKPPAPDNPPAPPAPRPPRPRPEPAADPPEPTVPNKKPPRDRPDEPAPPGHSAEPPGGFLVHIKLRTTRHRIELHIRVKAHEPHGLRHHRPRAATRHKAHGKPRNVHHHATHRPGRHGRLKPGSRGPRD